MKKRALMAFPKLTATEEMKQIAASDMPRKEKTKYGYVTEVCDYYVYLRCVVQAGILKAALFFPDYLRLDGNNPVYEVYLDKENRQFTTYDCLNQKWSEAKLDRLDWKHWYAKSSWVSEEEAAVIQTYLDNDKRGASAILQFQRAVRDEQLVQRHRLETDPYDFGVLEWFIRFYAEQAKKYRGKADLVLRTLMKLPYMNMKPDSREFSVLTKAGYRCDEIILANSLAVWADRLPDRLSSKSITAEKIATACGRMLLNAPRDLSEEFYEYLGWLFRFYNSFTVKYEGFQGLWEAVQYGLNPTAPKTLLWMNQTIQKDFPYRFDVFDPQYDDLAKELERDNYMELFTLQMLHSRQAIPLKQWLSRYQELTGADYGEYFRSCRKNSRRAFAFLVEKKEIDLWEFFEQHHQNGEYAPQLKLLREYALTISSWRCFRFVERLLAEYTFPQLQTIFGERFYFHECFVRSEGYYSRREYKTYISRPFLSAEQHRQLYDWVERSVFQTEPEKYEDFVLSALKAPEIQRLYDKKALAAVLRQFLLHSEYNGYEINRLKETFYSKEELEDERRAEAERKKQEKRLEQKKRTIQKREKLQQLYNGSAESLVKFIGGYYHQDEKNEVLNMAFDKLVEWPVGCVRTMEAKGAHAFFELCGELVKSEPRPRHEILNMVLTLIGGEAA